MKTKAKLILASAVFVAALMLLVPLSQTDMSGGGGIGNSDSDPIVLSNENASPVSVSTFDELISKISETSVNAVKLTNNIEATSKIEVSKTLTLDLNGQTLTLSGLDRIEVGAGGDLTITDSSTTTGKIDYTVASDENSAIKVAGNSTAIAKLTLEKCEIVVNENDNGNGYGVYAASYSEVTSGDGVTITAGYSAISGNGLNSGAKITITGGSYTSNNSAAIYFPSTNELTVTGGTFKGKSGFDIRAGTVSISGAEINATGSYTNVADDSDSTRTDIPTVWGMGIAIIDHASYSKGAEISITLSNLTFSSTTSVCDLYIGNFNQKTGGDAGRFNENNLDQTFTVNKKITVTVTDVLQYSVTKSTSATSGYLIVDDLNTSNKTFTVTNLFNKGDATVGNNGTIVVNDLKGLINAAAIGGNIQLAADIAIEGMNGALELINGTTLDLNGHTITIEQIGKSTGEIKDSEKYKSKGDLSVNANRIVTADGAIVIIKNGIINYTEDSGETGTEKTKSPLRVGIGSKESKLTLENVSISSAEYGIGVFKQGTLEVKNSDNNTIHGYVSAVTTNGSANSSPLTSDGAKIKLSGGKYTSTSAATIYFPGGETLDVVGGTFEGPTGFDIRAGTVNIKDATVKATGNTETTSKFSAANGPSGWGMGIAVFDHSSYAYSGTKENKIYLNINIIITNVTFEDCLKYNLYVGKHPGDNTNAPSEVSFSEMNDAESVHKISITIASTNFTGKGAVLKNVNDVNITNCKFEDISEVSNTTTSHAVDAILISKCTGDISIKGCTINNVKYGGTPTEGQKYYGRGIDIRDSPNCGSITIGATGAENKNVIKNVDFNAIQIMSTKASSISICNNEFYEWDSDNDTMLHGRAIRIAIDNTTDGFTFNISNNTFSKKYELGKTHDDFIVKITDSSGNSTIAGTTLSENTAEISFIADSAITDPYAEGLAILCKNFFVNSYASDDTKMNITVGNNDKNNKTHFTTKGLYIEGANNVTIQNCEFMDITGMIDSSPDAIQLVDCTGDITISDNKISNVAVKNPGKPNKGMGINIIYEAANAIGSITISDNAIEDTAHNAITVQSKSDKPVANILIEDNILSNWDSDSSNNTSENNNDLYYGGRAIRLATGVHSSGTSIISENTFIMAYTDPNRDNANILKATSCSPEFKNNILVLSGIDTYNYADLFIIGSDENKNMVTFNPNGGYYYTSSEPGVLCSIVAANESVSKPTDPSRSGSYSFDGWYDAATGGKEWNFATGTISADTTLYANWTYTGGSGGVPVTPPEEPVVEKEEVNNDDGTISSITETTVTKENDDGSKETIVEKEEVVKDKDGNVQSVIEEKQSEVVNKDGSTNKTSETVVKDKDGKVIEEKTEIEIEDKNTGVSTSVEVTKGSDGKTASEITTQTSVETKDGKAQVSSEVLNEALKQAEAAKNAAEEKGAKDAKPVIEIEAENSEDFTETEISAEDLSKLAEADVDVKIKTATGEVNIPPEVSKNLSSNADEKVSLSFGEADKEQLTEDQKKTVGDAPVFEFNLKSGEKDIHDLGGTVSVTVPYELKAGEDPNKITVWYIDEQGNPVAMNSVYDPETKSITFETSHFSYYFIAEDVSIPDDKKDDSSNNTIYYAVAAIVVILIIIALAYYFMKKKQ